MKIKKEKLLSILFSIAYFLIIFSDMVTQVKFINNYLQYYDYFAIIILLVVFIMQSKTYSLKSFILSVFLIILGILSSYFSKDTNILKLVSLILAFKDINFDEFIKKDFYFKIILVLFVASCYFLNLTDNTLIYRDGILRNSFGFRHPNRLGLYLMMICMDLHYIMRNKKITIPLIFSILISMFIYYFVDSRTSILIIILCNIIIIIDRIFKNKIIGNKFSIFISKHLFIILTILTLFLSYKFNYNNSVLVELNEILSHRLSHNFYFLTNYKINLFGNDVITTDILILDNSYVNIILRYGLVFLIFMYFNFYSAIKKLFQNKNYVLIIIFVLLLCYGFSESFLYKISANAFLLYFGKVYYDKNKEGDNK